MVKSSFAHVMMWSMVFFLLEYVWCGLHGGDGGGEVVFNPNGGTCNLGDVDLASFGDAELVIGGIDGVEECNCFVFVP